MHCIVGLDMAKPTAIDDDSLFISQASKLKKGQTMKLEDGSVLELEYDLNEVKDSYKQNKNLPFHQRIFPPGIILKKHDSNVRIFIEEEKLHAKKTGKRTEEKSEEEIR